MSRQRCLECKKKLTAELLVVAWGGPLALLDHLVDGAADLGTGGNDVVDGELVERSCILNVLERSLEVLELGLDLAGGSLRLLDLLFANQKKRGEGKGSVCWIAGVCKRASCRMSNASCRKCCVRIAVAYAKHQVASQGSGWGRPCALKGRMKGCGMLSLRWSCGADCRCDWFCGGCGAL